MVQSLYGEMMACMGEREQYSQNVVLTMEAFFAFLKWFFQSIMETIPRQMAAAQGSVPEGYVRYPLAPHHPARFIYMTFGWRLAVCSIASTCREAYIMLMHMRRPGDFAGVIRTPKVHFSSVKRDLFARVVRDINMIMAFEVVPKLVANTLHKQVNEYLELRGDLTEDEKALWDKTIIKQVLDILDILPRYVVMTALTGGGRMEPLDRTQM